MEEKQRTYEIRTGCDRGLCHAAVGRQDRQLNTYDWLADVPGNAESTDLVEVQFKHTRKGYYHNVNNLPLKKGDIVAVEASPGHDIGVVTLTGRLVTLQIKKANLKSSEEIKRVYRLARQVDMDKYHEAKAREHETMIQSREIAKNLGLQMKIGDVEYQGDGQKAIFYYIADERVDFRQLIKDLAAAFHVRIEMKQIGARQEAGRIGGTGPCGRELCCATWMKNFVSVSTGAARYQDISLNPQKLAGMCAKLKCCLNYEVDDYIEHGKKLPNREIVLQTLDSDYYFFPATCSPTRRRRKSRIAHPLTCWLATTSIVSTKPRRKRRRKSLRSLRMKLTRTNPSRTSLSRMKLKRNSLLGFIIAVALALSSCNRQTIYSHYEPVDIDGWERSDTLWFYAGGLTEGCYNEQVGLRINGNYPFKDLSLVVEQRLLSTQTIIKCDTLNLAITDDDGFFQGEGLSLLQYETSLGTISLPTSDTLQVAIIHNMKREVMPGIADVGITLQKAP